VTLPDVHLAEEALAAYVDGVLSPAAAERAERHLRGCAECRDEVDAQREAKALIAAAPDPELPTGLLAKLLDVPMTADLGGGDRVLAVAGDELGWATGLTARPDEPRLVERTRTAAPVGPGGAPSGRRSGTAGRPAGASGPGRQPRSPAAVARGADRFRRRRRGLAVSLAGLAFGVIASAASTTAPGTAAPASPGTGSSPTQLVVGTSVPLQANTFQLNRPAGGVLAPTRRAGTGR
jgi:putative zinc finger protein